MMNWKKLTVSLLMKRKWSKVTDRERDLLIEIKEMKEKIENYREMEVELSTTIDLLREGIIK